MNREELYRLVVEARNRCVVEHVPRYQMLAETDEANSEFILGSCMENAVIVSEYLEKRIEAPVYIIEGGLNIPHEPIPETHEDALDIGTVHHWVFVDVDGGYHCEIASESRRMPGVEPGEPFVHPNAPDDYIEFFRKLVTQS